ncbi:hypothetical protein HHI36_019209 [Cryptolaemus montrouzieri]|uniref:PiggyBac transposable element-derived protein domain-containing protein n=1 Tax=Cryptolaemus montrouzieri TaxID=559131 RepID=A0ABD2P2A7_9CUCU
MQKRFKILKVEELFCFLGLTLLMPRTKNLKLQEFWSRDSLIQIPVFGQIFARDRYAFFTSSIMPTGNDPLYKIRPLLDHFAKIFKTAFTLLFYFRERPKSGGGQRSAGDTPLPGTSKGAPSKSMYCLL